MGHGKQKEMTMDEPTAKLIQTAYFGAKKEAEKRGTVLESFEYCGHFDIRDAAVDFYKVSPPVWWSIDHNKMTRNVIVATLASQQEEQGEKDTEEDIAVKRRIQTCQSRAELQCFTDGDYLIGFDARQLDLVTFHSWKSGKFALVAGGTSIFRFIDSLDRDATGHGSYHIDMITKSISPMSSPPLESSPHRRRLITLDDISTSMVEAKKIGVLIAYAVALFGVFYTMFSYMGTNN